MNARILYLIPLIIFAGVVVTSTIGIDRDPNVLPSPLIGQPAPDFELPEETEQNASRSDWTTLSGKPAIVNFWASWCIPCKVEHPQLMRLSEDGRWHLIGINYKDTAARAVSFLGKLGNPFSHQSTDPDGKLAISWGVYGIPETFIVDAKGIIQYKHIGPITPEDLSERLEPVLQTLVNSASETNVTRKIENESRQRP